MTHADGLHYMWVQSREAKIAGVEGSATIPNHVDRSIGISRKCQQIMLRFLSQES